MAKFRDIKQITRANYSCTVSWVSLSYHLECWTLRYAKGGTLELNPDFQRGHIWSSDQQIAYIEFALRGGVSGKDIYWNCPGWMNSFDGPMQLVDGLQRITAILAFLDNKIPAYSKYLNEYEDQHALRNIDLTFHVADLDCRKDILQWYLDLNSGVAHTDEELARVKAMMRE